MIYINFLCKMLIKNILKVSPLLLQNKEKNFLQI